MTVVPQTGHEPLAALRPFFIVTSWPSNSRFALHFTQYASYFATCHTPFSRSLGAGAGTVRIA